MESELFGHEKGAFTGAVERRDGCFELAQHGTLLLDELGEMPVGTQAKLLRVLEDSNVRRIGGKSEIAIDVRVLASTNKVVEEALRKDELREDLVLPPQRLSNPAAPAAAAHGDLPLLTEALIQMLNQKHDTRVVEVHLTSAEQFKRYPWPGNVRELRNVLERAVILAGEGTITTHHLPRDFGVPPERAPPQQVMEPDAVRLPVGTTVGDAEEGAHSTHAPAHQEQQDARRRDSRNQSQDPVQQTQGVWSRGSGGRFQFLGTSLSESMSLKARLRIAIVALVTLVVIGMSVLYLYDFTRMTFRAASERAGLVADEIKGNLVDRLDRETAARGIHPGSLQEWKAKLGSYRQHRSQYRGDAQTHAGERRSGGRHRGYRRSGQRVGCLKPRSGAYHSEAGRRFPRSAGG